MLSKTQFTPFPIRFVFLKASEGGDFSDTTFVHNFDLARQYGFIRGAYHFYEAIPANLSANGRHHPLAFLYPAQEEDLPAPAEPSG